MVNSVGGFVYTGGAIPFTDIRGRSVRYVGPVGAELQGWLRAKEAGRYELATDLSAHFQNTGNSPPTCLLHARLEDHSLGEHTVYVTNARNNEASATLVLGADLQPGLYRLRLWMVCDNPASVATTSEAAAENPVRAEPAAHHRRRPAAPRGVDHRSSLSALCSTRRRRGRLSGRPSFRPFPAGTARPDSTRSS